MATRPPGRALSAFGLVAPLSSFDAPGASFSVDNTNDSGAGSLRQAILDANGNMGLDTIDFNITGAGIHTIAVTSVLPAVTDPMVIDGTTQPGYAGSPLVEVTAGPGLGYITAGIGGGLYGVNDSTLRQQMAVFITKTFNLQ
jgi:hypothetical protein